MFNSNDVVDHCKYIEQNLKIHLYKDNSLAFRGYGTSGSYTRATDYIWQMRSVLKFEINNSVVADYWKFILENLWKHYKSFIYIILLLSPQRFVVNNIEC